MKELLKAMKEERELIYQMYLIGDDRDDENIQEQTDFEDFDELDQATDKASTKRIKLEEEYNQGQATRELMERFDDDIKEWTMNVITQEQLKDLLEEQGYTDEEIKIVMS